MKRLALLLALTACAAPTPREFHDGPMAPAAPAFVTPGYTPAGAGLPEYSPRADRPAVERGTDRRMLPATREPGVWASDGDETRAAREAGPAILLNLVIPYPEPRLTGAVPATKACVALMGKSLYWSEQYAPVSTFPEDKQRCIAALLFSKCAFHQSEQASEDPSQSTEQKTAKAAVAVVGTRLVNKHCTGLTLGPDGERLMQAVYAEWSKRTGGVWWK